MPEVSKLPREKGSVPGKSNNRPIGSQHKGLRHTGPSGNNVRPSLQGQLLYCSKVAGVAEFSNVHQGSLVMDKHRGRVFKCQFSWASSAGGGVPSEASAKR